MWEQDKFEFWNSNSKQSIEIPWKWLYIFEHSGGLKKDKKEQGWDMGKCPLSEGEKRSLKRRWRITRQEDRKKNQNSVNYKNIVTDEKTMEKSKRTKHTILHLQSMA